MVLSRDVFVTGGTGYMGRRLVPVLLTRGHRVRVLARSQSIARVPAGASPVVGDALDAGSFGTALRRGDTVVHLVGTPHPSPAKAREFLQVDLTAVRATLAAALGAGIGHLVYVSVAHPAPVMQAYVATRQEGERLIREAGFTATVLRPWYVLGPGHRWPLLLLPLYFFAELAPKTREGARRLGLVKLSQMVAALVHAVEEPPAAGTVRTVEVPEIRKAGSC